MRRLSDFCFSYGYETDVAEKQSLNREGYRIKLKPSEITRIIRQSNRDADAEHTQK